MPPWPARERAITVRSGGLAPNHSLACLGSIAAFMVSPILSVVNSRLSLICCSVRPRAAISVRMGLFMGLSPGSVRHIGHAVGHGLDFTDAAPPRHQQEEAEV